MRVRGFTLIEILVAITLFAVVGGALLQLFSQGLRSTRVSSNHEHAVLLARSKLTELQAYNQLQPGSYDGIFGNGYRWRADLVLSSESTDENVRLRGLDLDLTIRWGEASDQRDFVLRSRLLTSWSND